MTATPVQAALAVPLTHFKICTVCEQPIPVKRLLAKPDATKCVPCLESQGDVPTMKRFDEYINDEVVETTFVKNQYLDSALRHFYTADIPSAAFETAAGDDGLMQGDRKSAINGGSLAEAIFDEVYAVALEDSLEDKKYVCHDKLWAEDKQLQAFNERKSKLERAISSGYTPTSAEVSILGAHYA